MEEKPKRWGILLTFLIIVVLVGVGAYLLFGGKANFISPIPAQPSFQVIYYTPTPGAVTPSSTPSATPKVRITVTKAPTATTAPTVAPSNTPTP